MKDRKSHKLSIAAAGAWWPTNVIASAKAFRYGRAAQRDERNGFPCTAALEWRKAAELIASKKRSAAYCWRQWERIMHLPRRLAVADASQAAAVPLQSSSTSPAIGSVVGHISFANAA